MRPIFLYHNRDRRMWVIWPGEGFAYNPQSSRFDLFAVENQQATVRRIRKQWRGVVEVATFRVLVRGTPQSFVSKVVPVCSSFVGEVVPVCVGMCVELRNKIPAVITSAVYLDSEAAGKECRVLAKAYGLTLVN